MVHVGNSFCLNENEMPRAFLPRRAAAYKSGSKRGIGPEYYNLAELNPMAIRRLPQVPTLGSVITLRLAATASGCDRDTVGNRQLHFDDFCVLMLLLGEVPPFVRGQPLSIELRGNFGGGTLVDPTSTPATLTRTGHREQPPTDLRY
jgi:hypothetical protein